MPDPIINAYVEGEKLKIIRRSASGTRVHEERKPEHVTYHRASEVDANVERKIGEVAQSIAHEGEWLRVRWPSPYRRGGEWLDVRRRMCDPDSPFATRGIKVYEGDVSPVLRHLVDEQGLRIAKPRRCYLDFESDSRVPFNRKEDMRILCWCLADDSGEIVAEGLLPEDTDKAERILLVDLLAALEDYDQVCAWNGDRFDFDLFEARADRAGIPLARLHRLLMLDHLMVFQRMNITASESGDEKTSMRLGDVAQGLLRETKDKFDASRTWQAWAEGHESRLAVACPGCGDHHAHGSRDCMLAYCRQDTRLLPKIEKKTGYLDLFFTICDACGILPDSRSTNPTLQVDGFMLRLGKARGLHFPTTKYGQAVEKFEGAYVMDPQFVGIAKGVHVCDFARLYPSIILTWNMSPETKVGTYDHERKKVYRLDSKTGDVEYLDMREGWARAPRTSIVFDTRVEGILPTALREAIRLRVFWNDAKAKASPGTEEWSDADRRSTAYKIWANSFYGVVGSPFSRYYDRQVAESVAQGGVFLIQATIAEGARNEPPIIAKYADTDSMFANECSDDEFAALVKRCNVDVYPRLCRELGCDSKSHDIKLAYEKCFARIVTTSKKRYVGVFKHYKGSPGRPNSRPEIKGLEFKRGDQSKLGRALQEDSIRLLVGDWDPIGDCCGHHRGQHDGDKDEKPTPCKVAGCACKGFVGTYPAPSEHREDYCRLVERMRSRVLEQPLDLSLCSVAKSIEKELPMTEAEVAAFIGRQNAKLVGRGLPVMTEAEEAEARDQLVERRQASGEAYKSKKKKDGTRQAYPPHVQIALAMKERGEEVGSGTKIQYVVADGSCSPIRVIPASEYDGTNADRYYLWEKLVWPPTERLLEAAFPGADWSAYRKARPAKPRAPRKGRAAPPAIAAPSPLPALGEAPARSPGRRLVDVVPRQLPPKGDRPAPGDPLVSVRTDWVVKVIGRAPTPRAKFLAAARATPGRHRVLFDVEGGLVVDVGISVDRTPELEALAASLAEPRRR